MARGARRKVAELEAAIADARAHVLQLERQQEELRARAAVLALVTRIAHEVAEHRRRFGTPVGPADAWAPVAEAESDALAAVRAAAAPGSADTPLEDRFPWLAPGRSILRLEEVTADEVEQVRAMTHPQLCERMASIAERVHEANSAIEAATAAATASARGDGGGGGGGSGGGLGGGGGGDSSAPHDPGALARARAELDACGREYHRTHVLGMIQHARYFEDGFCWRNFVDGRGCFGADDAPTSHYDAVAAACGFSREQAVLFVTTITIWRARAVRTAADRLALTNMLAARTLKDGGDVGGSFAVNGGGGGGGSGGGGGTKSDTSNDAAFDLSGGGSGSIVGSGAAARLLAPEEVLEALMASSARERELSVVHASLLYSIFMPSQLAQGVARSYPVPPNAPRLAESMRHLLKFGAFRELELGDVRLTAYAAPPGHPVRPGA